MHTNFAHDQNVQCVSPFLALSKLNTDISLKRLLKALHYFARERNTIDLGILLAANAMGTLGVAKPF